MISVNFKVAIVLILGIIHGISAVAQDKASHLSRKLSFPVGKDGRPILLPVEVNGQTLQFLLDTGAAKTCFDISLRSKLGKMVTANQFATPLGLHETDLYVCPKAAVGSFTLEVVKSVGCVDLSPIRYATGKEVYGILGVDFLAGKRFEIDFDTGTVKFDDAAENLSQNADAVVLPVTMKGGVPHIPIELPSGTREWIIADTGANQTTLRRQVFQELVESGQASVDATHRSATLGGMHDSRTGTLAFLQVGSYRVDRVVADSVGLSLLGLDQLSRFRIQFDLRDNRIVLLPGAQFAKSRPSARSGMSIIQVDGSKIVIRTTEGGAASVAGVVQGDRILKVNDTSVTQIDMFELRQLLTNQPKEIIELDIQRGSYPMKVQLQLRTQQSD